MRFGVLFISSFLFLFSCSGNDRNLLGAWVEPVPGMRSQVQGITLNEDSTAGSVNMATLRYSAWRLHNNCLILDGKSIGNGQTILFSDTFRIVKHSSDSLILEMTNNGSVMRYSRLKRE